MTIKSHYGNFKAGDTSITGVPFRPEVVLFFTQILPLNSEGGSCRQHCGAADENGQWLVGAYAAAGNLTTSDNAFRFFSDLDCIGFSNGGSANEYFAQFGSMTSDGFTLVWGVGTPITSHDMQFVAIAGANFHVGTYTALGGGTVTGIPFQPDFIYQATGRIATSVGQRLTATGTNVSYGFDDAVTPSGLMNMAEDVPKDIPSNTRRGLSETDSMWVVGSDYADELRSHLTGMTSDGFTYSTSYSDADVRIGYVAIGGVEVSTGVFTEPAADGGDDTTTGFQPEFLMTITDSDALNDSVRNRMMGSIGVVADNTLNGVQWNWDAPTGQVDKTTYRRHSALTVNIATSNAGVDNPLTTAAFDSWLADGFRLNWTDFISYQNRTIGYFAIKAKPTGNPLLFAQDF